MTTLTLQTDRSLIRVLLRSIRYVLATIHAPVAPQAKGGRRSTSRSVIDCSGSMEGEKIVLAREAVLEGIGMLRDTDRFAVVSFDNHVDSWCRSRRRPWRQGRMPSRACRASRRVGTPTSATGG